MVLCMGCLWYKLLPQSNSRSCYNFISSYGNLQRNRRIRNKLIDSLSETNVVVEELIPEMMEGKHSHIGVLSYAFGFTLMMVLDVALG